MLLLLNILRVYLPPKEETNALQETVEEEIAETENSLDEKEEESDEQKEEEWRIYPCLMTHKYRRSIVVLSINKSVEPNEKQKVLACRFAQGFTANTNRRIFIVTNK